MSVSGERSRGSRGARCPSAPPDRRKLECPHAYWHAQTRLLRRPARGRAQAGGGPEGSYGGGHGLAFHTRTLVAFGGASDAAGTTCLTVAGAHRVGRLSLMCSIAGIASPKSGRRRRGRADRAQPRPADRLRRQPRPAPPAGRSRAVRTRGGSARGRSYASGRRSGARVRSE